MMNGSGGAPMAGWMVLGLLVWIGLIVLAGIAVGRYLGGPAPRVTLPPHRETPLDLLERRYAEGTIDREEFDEARARIREDIH